MVGAAVGGAIGSVLDIATAGMKDRRARNLAESTGRDAMQREKEMSEHYYDLSMKKFEDTGYGAQVKQMKDAGLNAGLMYGMGGGTGGQSTATTSSQGGAITRSQDNNTGMGMQMGMQAMMQQAQIEALKSQANKSNAEAESIRGGKGTTGEAEIANKGANTNLTNINAELAQIQKEIANNTKTDKTIEIQALARKAVADMEQSEAGADVKGSTIKDEISRIKAEAIGMMLRNKATIAGTNLTEAQTEAIGHQITQGYTNAWANQRNSLSNEKNAETQLYNQIKDALYKDGLIKLGNDKLEQDAIMGIIGILSGKMPTTTISETTSGKGWQSTETTRK